ncbi:MAG: Asp-tRNA(Asn)/Glu-tRNA(Gln) amidotransferase subunit GatC [Phycisphaerales bacterium]|nr:Asp-tRNA(Asn)/Glu-tRNA(Gln) amidotransferase subunit GatC [Phycisphaerales bacterium]
MANEPLSLAETRKVATLSRLALTDAQLEEHRHHLGAILNHVRQLQALDLAGVEPMTSPVQSVNRLAEDVPGPTLSNEQLMAMAPHGAAEPPFIRVPKVIGGAESS